MRVLINPRTKTFHEIRSAEFTVAPPLRWVDAPDGLDHTWTFDGESFFPPDRPESSEDNESSILRRAREEALNRLILLEAAKPGASQLLRDAAGLLRAD